MMTVLLDAIHFCCLACIKETDTISSGNDRANKAAKYTARTDPHPFSTEFINLPLSLTDIIDYQTSAPQSEKRPMNTKGCQTIIRQFLHWAKQISCGPLSADLLGCRDLPSDGTHLQMGIIKELKDNCFCSGIHSFRPNYFPVHCLQCHQIFRRSQHTLRGLPRPIYPLHYSKWILKICPQL